MRIAILLIYNMILGVLLGDIVRAFKCGEKGYKVIGFRRFVEYGLLFLSSISYLVQVWLVIEGNYKLAISMDLICLFAMFALRIIVQGRKRLETFSN